MKVYVRSLLCFFLVFSFASTTIAIEDKLVFAIDIIRHGDRTPTNDIPKSPYPWKEGLGQLTPRGMQQENALGEKFRHRYVEKYQLLPAHYESETMYVRSTDLDRTLMSAESLLLGLYPLETGPKIDGPSSTYALPQGYQPIPIHTVANDTEMLLVPDHPSNYHYEELLKKYMSKDPAWQAKNQALAAKYPAWSKALGIPITNIYQLKPIADALYVRSIYHVALPEGITPADAKEITEAGTWAFLYPFRNKEIVSITTHRLQDLIKSELKDAAKPNHKKRYILFSAHDSTIIGQMSALGAPVDAIPHYASDLNFLLFQEGENNYVVKVIFNDKPLFIPQCGSTSCSLEKFLSV